MENHVRDGHTNDQWDGGGTPLAAPAQVPDLFRRIYAAVTGVHCKVHPNAELVIDRVAANGIRWTTWRCSLCRNRADDGGEPERPFRTLVVRSHKGQIRPAKTIVVGIFNDNQYDKHLSERGFLRETLADMQNMALLDGRQFNDLRPTYLNWERDDYYKHRIGPTRGKAQPISPEGFIVVGYASREYRRWRRWWSDIKWFLSPRLADQRYSGDSANADGPR
jgi:hypothetical protein